MERLTIRVPEEILAEIEHIASADDVSQSEAARQLLRSGSEYDRIRNERNHLRKELRATNKRVDEHTELVAYVEEERELQQRREERRASLASGEVVAVRPRSRRERGYRILTNRGRS